MATQYSWQTIETIRVSRSTKVKPKDKKFSIVGDAKAMTLGSHLWSKGKKIVVTGGNRRDVSLRDKEP